MGGVRLERDLLLAGCLDDLVQGSRLGRGLLLLAGPCFLVQWEGPQAFLLGVLLLGERVEGGIACMNKECLMI